MAAEYTRRPAILDCVSTNIVVCKILKPNLINVSKVCAATLTLGLALKLWSPLHTRVKCGVKFWCCPTRNIQFCQLIKWHALQTISSYNDAMSRCTAILAFSTESPINVTGLLQINIRKRKIWKFRKPVNFKAVDLSFCPLHRHLVLLELWTCGANCLLTDRRQMYTS
jgi:hypothetical protein